MIDRAHGYFDKDRETRSKEKREAYLKEKLSEILHYGYRYSKAIRSMFEKVGLMPDEIKDLKGLEKLQCPQPTL